MSATGHQVLSFVTSGEMTDTPTGTSAALGEITEGKDGCDAEFVIPAFAATAYGRIALMDDDLITTNYQ